ncbi:hypothetical protein [Haloprofundus halobius]|uniref:hypothetical protein n=1 Tax=Haloprofundus halobius TaxID=2876194 RepID=UPI001CCAE3F8|nr:hypothetical protein [Haloprofundus halobius]
MQRAIIGLLGLTLALFPERVREIYERLALDNPDDCVAKASFHPAIRTEGLLFVATSLLGGSAYAWQTNALGATGVVALLFPKRSLDFSAALTYEHPEAVEWRDGLVTAVRGFGILYVAVALSEAKKRRSEY